MNTLAFETHPALTAVPKMFPYDAHIPDLARLKICQIHDCSHGVMIHLLELRRHIDGEKIEAVAYWRESQVFSERETFALLLAETLSSAELEDMKPLIAVARGLFTQDEIVHLVAAIEAVNEFVRLDAHLEEELRAGDEPSGDEEEPHYEIIPEEQRPFACGGMPVFDDLGGAGAGRLEEPAGC